MATGLAGGDQGCDGAVQRSLRAGSPSPRGAQSPARARRRELLALQWPAVNFDTVIITIAHRLEQTKPVPLTPGGLAELTVQERRMPEQGLRIKETKGRKIRQLRLSEEAIQTLRGIQARQEENRRLYGSDYCSNLDLVFCHPDGFFIRPDTVTKAVRRLAKKAAFAGVSLHTLRHSHGSQLLGVPLPAVSKRLGHSNLYVTASIYSHALPPDEIAAGDTWGKAMTKAIENPSPEKKSAKILPMPRRESA